MVREQVRIILSMLNVAVGCEELACEKGRVFCKTSRADSEFTQEKRNITSNWQAW